MQISEWITEKNTSIRAFAREIGEDGGNFSRVVNGQRLPPAELMIKVHVHTKGKVSIEDWIELRRDALIEKGVLKEGYKRNGRSS